MFVDDRRVQGCHVDGDNVTMGREGAYQDQLEDWVPGWGAEMVL